MKFINLTAHALTADQIAAAKELGVTEFLEAADVLPPDVLAAIRNCPGEKDELTALANKMIDAIKAVAAAEDPLPLVHLPAGSPALMWKFCDLIGSYIDCVPYAVFSHSVRDSVETVQPDGTVIKKSVFRFEKFIIF